MSCVKGFAQSAAGEKVYGIEGSWMNQMSIRDLKTDEVDVIWTEPLMDPDAHL